jgi:phage N-6-adenine-methyltransferase
MEPRQKRGRSKQDYRTPPEFLRAVKRRLQIEDFTIDLAASHDNRVTEWFYSEGDDALTQSWNPTDGWAWCNPPFGRLALWVEKAYTESQMGANIAMLVPASVGANWWHAWVHRSAYVEFLNGRLTFVGQAAPYPKDCALLLYSPWGPIDYDVWRWGADDLAETY